jgi:hypothetical protein
MTAGGGLARPACAKIDMQTRRATPGLRARAAVFLAFLALSAASIASQAHAQTPTQDSDPQPTGFARITGRVLASDDGRPVRRAVVRLSGSAVGTQSSDPEGG